MCRLPLVLALVAGMSCAPRAQHSPAAEQSRDSQTAGTSGQEAKGKGDLTPKDAIRIPPMPPVDVQVEMTGNRKAVLSWRPSRLDTVTSYLVYRKAEHGTFEKLAEVSKPAFVDAHVPAGKVIYSVAAKNVTGAESILSEPAVRKTSEKAPSKK